MRPLLGRLIIYLAGKEEFRQALQRAGFDRRDARRPYRLAAASPSGGGLEAPMFRLIPAELATLILFFQPRLQRLEVLGRGAGGDVFAGGFLQNV